IWSVTADAGTNFGGSVIFGDKILIGDDAGYDCRLTADGSLVWDQNTDVTVSGLFGGATGNRTQATVATVGATQTAFLGNGLNRDVVAVDANTGAYLWHNTTNAPFPGLHPNTNNLKSVVVNDGAIDVLYYAAQTKVYAVDAATGAPYAGWPAAGAGNPFVMGADNINAVSTDGTNLFVPTFSGAIAGNIYALDLATGALVWDLATVLGDANLWASINGNANYINDEGFFSGASYDDANNSIWANSYFTSDFPGEGYLYHLDAVSGAPMNDPQGSVRSRRATPTIDQNKIYVPVFTRWAGPVYNGFGVYSRSTGFLLGGQDGKIAGDRQYNDGVLTCEPGADDWFIHGTELGELNFFRMGNADQWMFSRKTTLSGFNGGQWNGGSMGVDVVAFSNLGGITVALAPGADRPRLDILNDPIEEPVEFGSPDPINVVFPDAFTNLGCADLLIDSITFDDGSPSAPTGEKIELTTVDPALLAKMNEYAQYTTNSERFMKVGLMFGEQSAGAGPEYRYAKPVNSSLNYRAAAAFPAVVNGTVGENGLVSPLSGSLIPPGDIVDITVAIKGPLVTRGPHPFLASLYTNDLDYFMDDPTQIPTITLTPVGGCLEDSVRIFFGAAGENSTTVYNNGNLARFTGNGANDIDINGFVEGATDFCGGTLT
ncbi:MAG: PQQ-binding-like beta-propeller repeat protein, partial [Candidatus Zixiibacteriota bacterium]